MKAIVIDQYGGPEVLALREVNRPEPKSNEIRVKVEATSVNYGDLVARNFKAVNRKTFNMPSVFLLATKLYFGCNKPKIKILGSVFAGVVESTGSEVTKFKTGDRVFGYIGQPMGAYAEYLTIAEKSEIMHLPDNLSPEEAASIVYGAVMAVPLLKKAQIKPGQKVLINGASGGIGSVAVQLAKHLGAEVTGVGSTKRLNFMKALGADHVIDYTQEDFTRNGQKYDLILDVLGRTSFSKCKNSLTENGRLQYASFKTRHVFQMLWTSLFSKKKVKCTLATDTLSELPYIHKLIQDGIIKSFIDKIYTMEEIQEAHRYMESGNYKGHIGVRMV